MQIGQEKPEARQESGSWCLEGEGPASSASLRGRREANPPDAVTV